MTSFTGPGTALQEILYGFIMALIFVYGVRFGVLEFKDAASFSLAVIGMCVTWGIIDGIIFYYIWVLDSRRQTKLIANEYKLDRETRINMLMDDFAGTPMDVITDEDKRAICDYMLDKKVQSEEEHNEDRKAMFLNSVGCAFFGSIPVIPILLPLLFFDDYLKALEISCYISSALLFLLGYKMARYLGTNRLVTGLVLAGISLGISIISVFTGG